jgi:hypothetical protein
MFREEKDAVVQRVNEYRFYDLGQKINAIRNIQQDTDYGSMWMELWEARDALELLKADAISVRVSVPVVDRLVTAITNIVPLEFKEAIGKTRHAEGSPAPKIGFPYYELSESLKAFEPVLAAECNALDTYVVSQKRGYATSDLVERAVKMLPQETIIILPPTVAADINAAGRCLAFDTPTAAGFHVLRAVEAVMALYYKHLTGKELPKQNRNWGLYLKKLKTVPSHDAKISGALDHIRENYRNPITHPDETLTEGHAIMLFGLSLSVTELMAEELRRLPPALTQLEELKALNEIAAAKAEEVDDF